MALIVQCLHCCASTLYFCYIYHFSSQLVSVLEHSAKLKEWNPVQGEVLCLFVNEFLRNRVENGNGVGTKYST